LGSFSAIYVHIFLPLRSVRHLYPHLSVTKETIMKSVITRLCNTELQAPREWTGPNACEPLPVCVGKNDSFKTFTSFWRPTKEEIDALSEGAMVILTVVGDSHPPVQLGVDFAAECVNAKIVNATMPVMPEHPADGVKH
jgi:hypothetical protein